MGKKYTRQFLLDELRRFYNENGRSPKIKDMKCYNGYPSETAYKNEFKTFNNALIIAELDINHMYSYSKSYLISELHRYVENNNTIPYAYNMGGEYPSASTYMNIFGSWNNALEAAKLPIHKFNNYDYTIQNICTSCGCIVIEKGNLDSNRNFVCIQCYQKNWKSLNIDKVKLSDIKYAHNHRLFGFIPINKKFEYSEAHHLHIENVTGFSIFIPTFIHKLHYHNHHKPETMITPNTLALDYWINEEFYNDLYLTGGE